MVSSVTTPAHAGRHREELLFQAVALVLAAVAGFGCWFAAATLARKDELRPIPPDKPRQLASFSLIDRTGRTVTRAELGSNVLAVSFLFTGCAASCPVVSQNMAEIQKLIAGEPGIKLVSFTVDPRSDTPPVLMKWGQRYGADTNRWLMLTGDKPALRDVVGTSFLATGVDDPFNSMPCNFIGTDRIALVDKHGQVRTYFNGTRLGVPAVVAAELKRLQQEQ